MKINNINPWLLIVVKEISKLKKKSYKNTIILMGKLNNCKITNAKK